jgi:hypothetical protein
MKHPKEDFFVITPNAGLVELHSDRSTYVEVSWHSRVPEEHRDRSKQWLEAEGWVQLVAGQIKLDAKRVFEKSHRRKDYEGRVQTSRVVDPIAFSLMLDRLVKITTFKHPLSRRKQRPFSGPTIEELFQATAGYGIYSVQFNLSCAGLETFPENVSSDLVQRITDAAEQATVERAAISGTSTWLTPILHFGATG